MLSLQLPDLEILTHGLTSALRANGYTDGEVKVLDRQSNIYASTFPSEIVTCLLADGSKLKCLCKYATDRSHKAYGHRGDVSYEAEVYRHVLEPLQLSTPTLYGIHTDPTTGKTWLIIEYLEESMRVSEMPEPTMLGLVARWLGQFHAANEARASSTVMPFLNTYDAEYYLGWVRRTLLFTKQSHQRSPWLATLCKCFEECVTALMAPPPTIIHGEYTPHNVLLHNGAFYPIDWESAAIAVGEIDLVSLTERWPTEIVRQCKLEYQRARWPESTPPEFEETLGAAELYWSLRWLGDQTTHEKDPWRFEQLRSVGERLGLI